MNTKTIVDLRKQAEEAVADMVEGPLKVKAFEVVLETLLAAEQGSASPLKGQKATLATESPTPGPKDQAKPKTTTSCPERILVLRDEGFFKTPRTIGEIRDQLQVLGWTYPVTTLSGPLQRLAQRRELRRVPGQDANAGSYTYVAP
jgi:hypothetical protein